LGSACRTANWVLLTLAALGVVATMAGCVSEQAQDQRLASTREATRGAVLAEVEATMITTRFQLPSPTPAPTLVIAPALANLVLARSVSADGSPLDEIRSVPTGATGTIYAAAEIAHLRAGQRVIAVWTNAGGAELGRSEYTITMDAPRQWVALPWTLDGTLPPGWYAVLIYVDDTRLNSLAFRIG
jgi:hypothetical protein